MKREMFRKNTLSDRCGQREGTQVPERPEDLLDRIRALESSQQRTGSSCPGCGLFLDAFGKETLLWDFAEGFLDEQEEDQIWSHLEICSSCRRDILNIRMSLGMNVRSEDPRVHGRLSRAVPAVEAGLLRRPRELVGWVLQRLVVRPSPIAVTTSVFTLLVSMVAIWNWIGEGASPHLTARIISSVRANEAVPSDEVVLVSGECFQVQCSVDSDAYLYVFYCDAQGKAGLLFPGIAGAGDNLLKKDLAYVVPQAERWCLGSEKGIETLYLLARNKPLDDPGQTVARLQVSGVTAPGGGEHSQASPQDGCASRRRAEELARFVEAGGSVKTLKIRHR